MDRDQKKKKGEDQSRGSTFRCRKPNLPEERKPDEEKRMRQSDYFDLAQKTRIRMVTVNRVSRNKETRSERPG